MPDRLAPGGTSDAVRRSPFGTNPQLGARGQRTRQRVLDAALRVFREVGVQRGSIDRITREAGCSRAAFYQYFADKDDVLRHLAAQLTLHLDAAVAWLEPVTAGADGWRSLRDLLERWAEVHDRHRPVLAASPQLFEADPVFASGATQARERYVAAIAARVQGSDLSPGVVAATIDVFLMTSHRALEDLDTLRQATPASFPLPATLDALADVVHRALFGLDTAVNVHAHDLPAPPRLPFGPLVSSGLEPVPATGGDSTTRAALLDAARRSFLALGYHGTRIDTIAEEAGVSHGTIYTYFDSKDHVAQVLALDAMRGASDALQRMPDVEGSGLGRAELRRWLGEYNRAQAGEAAMIGVWTEALRDSGDPVAETAPTLDWGRRRLARRLAERGFGDADLDAALLLSLLAVMGSRERSTGTLDATALVIHRGFFGHPSAD